ncbi:MAG TPA: beta-ketoacyl synthase N-terminal-like domain-containing protein, partial [Vicinamibacterales bacterium]
MKPSPPIAVVGVSALFPGSADGRGFWRDILAGKDLLTEVPETHWLIEDYYDPDPATPDKMYCRRGGFLQDTPFSPLEFGVPPNILPATDTAQLLALIVARRVLEDATGGDLERLVRQRVSVMLGVASTTELTAHMAGRLQRPLWLKAIRASGLPESTVAEIDRRLSAMYVPWQESTFPGLLANVVSGRIANQMDLGGTNCVIDAACASSLAALSAGLNELYLHQADLVIAGGVDTLNDILMFMCFAKTTALSPTEDCRPFSARADGTMLGEGLGMFALKRLDDAERDGDRVYAVIRGLGSSSDGYAKSIYAPRPEGQALALRRAYERAGYDPRTVELVEAHGTATRAGDRAEFEALRMVFDEGSSSDRRPWCALGSVKSQIGHTKAAAGAASLFKAIMALHHKVLPPTIKVDAPNPELRIDDSPFYLNTRARPWIHGGAEPRRAAVSSFGFGGTNFHVTLEEYTPTPRHRRIPTRPAELVLLSAADHESLIASARALAARPVDLRPLARETQRAFDPGAPVRLAVVAADAGALGRKLEQCISAIVRHPDRTWASPDGTAYSCGETPGTVAFLFPGQGSQYLEMGRDAAIHLDAARTVWDRAAAMPMADIGLHDVVFPPPAFGEAAGRLQHDRLTRTEWAQPAIAVTSASLLSIVRSLGIEASCMAGHSFGEITALYAAGALNEADFVRVAYRRGALMAAAPAVPGAMTAASASGEVLRELIGQWDLDLVVANCNSPSQTVLSGPTTAIEAAEHALAGAGIAARRLAVSTAFHSHLVRDASRALRTFLDDIAVQSPSVTVFGNADAAPYPDAADGIRDRIAAQIASPVLFEQQIHAMYVQGVRTFLEVGPGSVLSGLVDEVLQDREHLAIPLDRRGKDGITVLLESLGRLAVRGVPMAFDALWEDDELETTKTERPEPAAKFVIPIRGANHGKPYPGV